MRKIKIVANNLGATSNGMLIFKLEKIDYYIEEEKYEDYPVCVKFSINGEVFRAKKDEFLKEVKKDLK